MTRPTKTIVLPKSGVQVVINEWLNVEDDEYVNEPALKAASVRMDGKNLVMDRLNSDATFTTEITHRTIERGVVSIDGETDVIAQFKQLPASDGIYLIEEINGTQEKKDQGEKSQDS